MTITVTDNGTGLAETDLQKLNLHIQGIQEFSEFGVALRNIHTRIQMLFGTQYGIFINSTHYQGTTVTITLPAKEKKELENYYKLLIVDDEILIRNGIQNLIEWEIYGIEIIGEAEDEIKTYLSIKEEKPDLVLVDISMPNMNGFN